ncbi:hypothetical protein H4R20_000438 [Coemansia guatemalensis]|uniref:CCHC-type domain-containing protein n=1 Tax=Coemansia guatemalensis TaxID=2761395 RepID=A0A9W8I3U1_9FUNG|nr:hypothetical protein H4R20_000438 [Coemansia guatemalensis]
MNSDGYRIELGGELDHDTGSASSGSEGIDSDVEERIMSHLYYQTNEMVAANSTPMKASETTEPLELESTGQNADNVRNSAVAKEVNGKYTTVIETPSTRITGLQIHGSQDDQQQEEESKYSIKSKRNGSSVGESWHMDSDAAVAGARSKSADQVNGPLLSESDRNGDRDDHALTVTMVPAYRPATPTDGEDEAEANGKGSNSVAYGNDAAAGASESRKAARSITYNSSDHRAVNGYLDTISSSRLTTPPDTRAAPADSTLLNSGAMEQQTVQIDALFSPMTLSAEAAAGSMVHITPVKRHHADDEIHEYDYLDEAEIQGHNRYFMEEKETICRRCHKAGHIAKDCTTVACTVCGKEGHASKDCKQSGVVCHGCNMRGHIMSECPQRSGKGKSKHLPRRGTCDRCSSRYHHTEECATIWRRYVYADPLPSEYNSVMPWCYNCASEGHFGDECQMPPARSAASFRGDTAFNSQNCPGKVLSKASPKRSNNSSNRDHPSYYSSDRHHHSKSSGRSNNRTPSSSRGFDIRGSSTHSTPRRGGGKFRNRRPESPWTHKTPTRPSRYTPKSKAAEDSGGARSRHGSAPQSVRRSHSKKR